jgi:hypothetical protein
MAALRQFSFSNGVIRSVPAIRGLHLAMEPGFPEMTASFGRNFREGWVGLVRA